MGICRIHEKESAVVCPVIDVIDWNTFEYLGNSGEPQIGGFDWRLVFTWHVVPQRERKLMRSPIDVIRSGLSSWPLISEPVLREGWLTVDFHSLPRCFPRAFISSNIFATQIDIILVCFRYLIKHFNRGKHA